MDSKQSVYVLFRYDDVSQRSNFEFEKRFAEVLRQSQSKCTFAVIPQVCMGDWRSVERQTYAGLSASKSEFLKQLVHEDVIDVALHGLTHQTDAAEAAAEFIKPSGDEQSERIALGKQLIFDAIGTQVRSFVPPWNRFNQSTVGALLNNQFHILSAGAQLTEAVDTTGMLYLPMTANLESVKDAAFQAGKLAMQDAIITVELHEYDFSEVSAAKAVTDLPGFSKLLRALKNDPMVSVAHFSDIIDQGRPWQFFPPRSNRLKRILTRLRKELGLSRF
jgi:peptidoglycan/xylan/chitin deacetylase (PgdA/CDA1 family)